MKTRWSLFTYPVMDIKAAQEELCRRGEEGWRLKKVWFRLLACYEPAQTPVTYFVDWTDPLGDEAEDYVDLCAQAGWTLCQRCDHWNIYEAPAGTPPIQTDTQLEYQRFRDKVVRWWKLSAGMELIMLVLLGIICLGQPTGLAFPLTLISSSTALGLALFFSPLILLGCLLWTGRLGLRLIQWWSAARSDQPMPVPGRLSTGAAKLLCLLPPVWCIIMVLALAMDSLDGRENSLRLAYTCISAALVLLFYRRALRQRQRVRLASFLTLAVMVPVLAIHTLAGPVTASLMVKPPLEQIQVLPLSQAGGVDESAHAAEILVADSVGSRSSHSSFFLGHSGWKEEEFNTITLIPNAAPVDLEVYQRWDAWTARWNWLADGMQSALADGNLSPLPGYDGVWNAGTLWLIRRDNTVLRVETSLPADQWLDQVLSALEG